MKPTALIRVWVEEKKLRSETGLPAPRTGNRHEASTADLWAEEDFPTPESLAADCVTAASLLAKALKAVKESEPRRTLEDRLERLEHAVFEEEAG
jgi:predicted nucleic acid-binding protein